MTIFEILQTVMTVYATFWALYLLLFPFIASLWRSRGKTIEGMRDGQWPTMAIIMPARNMSGVIAKSIGSLQDCHYPMEKVDTYVIADHCSDDTAKCAESAGATALIRNEGLPGKTYALAWALEVLRVRGVAPELYVIVDATVELEPNFLTALAKRWQQGEDVITSHSRVSAESHAWYARCLGLMLVHRNLQNWSREQLGLSALLEGRGMAYSQAYVQRYGWHLALPAPNSGFHPTEDWRHAVRAVEQGYRVAFAQDSCIATPLRNSLIEATKQGSRWERGRMVNAGTYALRLLIRGLWQRDVLKIFAALDAIQPPVAILGGLSLGLAATSAFVPSASLVRITPFIPLTLVVLYGLEVVHRGRREGIGLAAIIWAPLYIAWRCTIFVFAWGFLDRVRLGRPQRGVG
jgi:cellulose synthase/poly-beta-1,6-N-acetylglucosamine synthase-like glycosyltransferase